MDLLRRLTPGVKALMAIHALAWIIIQPLGSDFFRAIVLDPDAVLHGRIWQLVTHIFAVPNLGMLFFVLLALFFFAPVVEQRLGRRRFLTLYL
ncbi:MAG: rhomboid family intramembrane serine protease, partial [Myxococcota bacterium]